MMRLRDVLDNRQAEAGAAEFAAAGLVHPIETLKEAGVVLAGNTAAGILHGDQHAALRLLRAEDDLVAPQISLPWRSGTAT